MAVTGACNTIVDLGLLNLLLLAGLGSNDAGRLLASGIAYCIASLNAYYWHDRWVFASNLGPRPRPVLWFGGVGLVAPKPPTPSACWRWPGYSINPQWSRWRH